MAPLWSTLWKAVIGPFKQRPKSGRGKKSGRRPWFWRRWGSLGVSGEDAAAAYLKSRGLKIVEVSARSRLGEIDLVALDGNVVVFVEVKTRRGTGTHPFSAVGRKKQARLSRLALAYLKKRRWLDRPARFDVVAVLWPEGAKTPHIEHLPNAFESQH